MPEDQTPPEVNHVPAESNFMQAAEKQVDALIKAAKLTKVYIRLLAAACVVLILGCAVLGYVVKTQYDTTQQLRHDSIASCQSGNDYKAGQTAIWREFIDIALSGKGKNAPTPEARAAGRQLLLFVENVDAPRNCAQSYSTASTNAQP